jgi:hypothetical protein
MQLTRHWGSFLTLLQANAIISKRHSELKRGKKRLVPVKKILSREVKPIY